MNNKLIRIAGLSSICVNALILGACGGDSSDDNNGVTTRNVSLDFAAMVGTTSVACGEMTGELVGTANDGNGSSPDIKDFRLYISSVQVAGDDGEFVDVTLDQTDWQYQNVALLDFEDGSSSCTSGTIQTNTQITGSAEVMPITQVRFTVGVPEQLNHLDASTAASPLNLSGMHWNWAGGYKHMRLDVAGWNIHLGTTGCTLDENNTNLDCSKARPNRPVYSFDRFSQEDDTITLDYAALVKDSDITTNTEDTPPGCMSAGSDPECAEIFSNLGLNVTTGECADADDGCDSQTWVSIK